MSKIKEYVRHLTVVAAATLLAHGAWAEATTSKVISFNFSDQSGSNATDTSGVYNVAAGAWNNFSSNANTRTGDLKMWDGSQSVNAGANFSIQWNASGWYGCGATDNIQKRYLDDGKKTSITISNIPFAVYDVYIICSTDQGSGGKFAPWIVNETTYGDASGWGDTTVRGAPTIGSNTLKISRLSGDLSMTGYKRYDISGSVRGCIAALQIVEAPAKGWVGNDGNWDDASNWSPVGVPTEDVEVGIDSACTVTLSENSRAKRVVLTDNVTFDGSETGAVLGQFSVLSGKKMTINADTTVGITGGSLKQTEVTNNGTIKFIGGTEEAPIKIYDNGANTGFGNVVLAENTVVLNTEDNNRIHKVTGSGATSVYKLTRTNNGFGHTAGTQFRNLTYVNAAENGKLCWVERADSFDATVDVRLDGGEFYLYGYSPTIGSLSGSAALTRGGNETITITCGADAEYAGASSVPMTIAAGNGVQTLSGAYTGALTVNAGGKVKIAGNAKPASYTVAEGGQVIMANGNIASMREIPAWMSFESGVTQLSINQTSDEYSAGSIVITGVPETITSIQVFTLEWKYETLVKDPEVAGKWSYSGSASPIAGPSVWLDYTFSKDTLDKRGENRTTIVNAGSAGTNVGLTYDTGYRANPTGSEKNPYNTENGMLLAASTPYRDMTGDQAWPTAYTVAVCANVPDVENACLVGFGSSTKGNNTFVTIVRGADSNTIKLMKGVGTGSPATQITTMSADNATTSKHLIVFTNDGTTFKVYCDGVKIEETSAIALGNGFQIGSVHGGVPSNLIRCSGIADETKRLACEIKSIRVFNKVISDDEMTALVDEFPYISKGGLYERTISADTTLSSEDAWADSETKATTDLPTSVTEEGVTYKPSIAITTTSAEAAKLTLNASLEADKITFNGSGELQIYTEGDYALSAAGAVIVNGPIAFKHGLVDISKSPLKIGTEGVMRIDVEDVVDLSTIFSTTRIQLTGVTEEAEGKVILLNAPESDDYRTVALAFEENHYWLKVTMSEHEAMTLSVGADLELTDATEFVTESGTVLRTNPDDVIEISADCTITIPTALTIPLSSITIPEGKTLTLVRGEGVACPKILGAGTIVMSQIPGRVFQDEGWTGVVHLKNLNLADWDLGAYGNMDVATIKLTGVTGYSKNGASNNGCNAAVELADDEDAKALTINNGYSDAVFFFRKVTGSGTFTSTDANTSHQVYKFQDVTGFNGMIEVANNLRVVIGTGDADSENSSLAFTDGVVINGGLNWSAAKVTFGNTLKVKGAIYDAIVTATTLPETMPKVTLLDADGQPVEGEYTLEADGTTLKVVKVGSPIEPIAPTQPKTYDTEDEATAAAEAINANKTELIAKPFETMTDQQKMVYDGYVAAKVSGTTVTIDFSEAGAEYMQMLIDDKGVSEAILDLDASSAEIAAVPGFYYAILGGTDVSAITTSGAAVQATGSTVTLEKPNLGTTSAGFYKVKVSVTALTAAE